MKLLYIVIDGMGDLPNPNMDNRTPLEAAQTPNLDMLAQRGQTGLMYSVRRGVAPESDVAVISLLGYDPFKYSTGRGIIEAVGSNIALKDGDLALRCNFATLGQDSEILDRRAGRSLTREEATQLSEAANKQITLTSHPATFQLKNTLGHRAVLVIKSQGKPLLGKISNTDPAYGIINGLGVAKTDVDMHLQKCTPLDDNPAAQVAADLVNEFTQKSHALWDNHPVNQKREREGKPKANVVLSRDAGSQLPNFFSINQHYGVDFAALADMQAENGIAKLAGMQSTLLPPSSGDLQKDCQIRVEQLLEVLPKHDCFYIHLKGPDEPGHDGDCEKKTEVISAIDKYFFGALLPHLDLSDVVFCVTADHSTPCMLKVHSDTPVPLLISGGLEAEKVPVRKFCEKECAKGSLGTLEFGYELMPKLMALRRKEIKIVE